MEFPTLSGKNRYTETTEAWSGYDHRLRAADTTLWDEQNLCSDDFPILSTRRRRGTYARPNNANGLIEKDSLCYVDGRHFVINEHRVDMGLSDGEKQLVSMGARVIIFPDKKYINTADLTDYGNLEAETTTSGTVTFTLSTQDGKDVPVDVSSPTAPSEPTDGMYWIDTGSTPNALKQWSEVQGMWVTIATTFIKIACTGIGLAFEEGDGVQISGLKGVELHDPDGEVVENEAISGIDGSYCIMGKSDDYIVIVGILGENAAITNAVHIGRYVPIMDFVIERDNRLWGCRYGPNRKGDIVNELYSCKLGDPKNWEVFQGVSTDSYIASLGSDGQFTGAVNHRGYAVFFKENCLHKVYGNFPANFQVQTTPCRGVQKGSHKSLQQVNEVLYYLGTTGVCSYDGALPVEVSAALGNDRFSTGVAGSYGNRYYIAMKVNGGDSILHVLDTASGIWHKEDRVDPMCFCRARDELYYIDNEDGSIRTVMGSGEADSRPVEWMAETNNMGLGSMDAKRLARLQLRLSMEEGAWLDCCAQYDSSGRWELLFHIDSDRLRTFDVPVRIRRCDHMKLRLEGKGGTRIYSLVKTFEAASGKRNGRGLDRSGV